MNAPVQPAIDRLVEAIERTGNPTALGLDTRFDYLPQSFIDKLVPEGEWTAEHVVKAISLFNRSLIDALCDIVPCVKVQVAFYEMLGVAGMELFRETLLYAAHKGMATIADVKRNDIGSTAEAYSAAYLGTEAPFGCDFITVNAYLGSDGIEPFLKDCRRGGTGLFVLVRTSNPSAGDFQDLLVEGRPLYEHMGDKVASWGADLVGSHGYSSVGAVVGATWPEEGGKLRRLLPQTFFLVPGYGAQGASAKDLIGCFDAHGGGVIVNASRSLLCAHKKRHTHDYVSATRDEALSMRDDLRLALSERR